MQTHRIRMPFFTSIIIGVVLTLLLAACGADTAAPDTGAASNDANVAAQPTTEPTPVTFDGEAVIYVAAPLSGRAAGEGQAQAAGARLAAEILNEQGGVLGREIVVKVVNDRGTPEHAATVAAEIVAAAENGETVLGVIASETSDPQYQAVQAVYLADDSALDSLIVVPASTSPLASPLDDPRFFRLSAPNSTQSAEIAATLQENRLLDVLMVQSETRTGDVLAGQFTDMVAGLDITLLDTVTVDDMNTDFSATAEDIIAQNPAALFLATEPFESSQLLTALYNNDYQGAIYAADMALPYSVVDELGCQAEGLYRASVVPSPSTVMADAQLARYAANEGRVAEPFSVAGYAAVEFIVRSYAAAGDIDASAAAGRALNGTTTTLIGDLRFDADGDRIDPAMHFQQVQARLFQDAYSREVGSPVQSADADDAGNQTYLDLTFADDAPAVTFADLNWNSALFNNAIARIILESAYAVPTYAVPGSTVPSFQRLTRGEVDVVMERYNFDDSVSEALASSQIVDLGVNFTNAVQGWFVPRYVIEGDSERGIDPIAPDLSAIDDLERYVRTFSDGQGGTGQFYGGVPGWTAHKINCLKLKAYRLDDNYAQVTSSSTSDLFGALDAAYDAGEPILLYLWSPTWPLAEYDLVQLSEPDYTEACWQTDRGCAYPTSDVRILAHGDLPERAPDAAEFLRAFSHDIEQVTEFLLRIEAEGLTPDAAARLWLQAHEDVWAGWLDNDDAQVQAVRAALS